MGNSSSHKKPKNKLKVRFSVRNFAIHGLPQKPAEWGQRIDERMWNEFVTCVRTAATLDNAEERKIEYKKWYCNFWLGILLFMIGIGCAIGMGLGGGLSGTTVVWVFAIILGVFGVIGGMILLIVSANRYGEINKEYISDVKSNVSSQLMQLNTKYTNIIRFTVLGTGNNIFKSKEDADTTINIPIEIEIFAPIEATVQYIPDQNMMIQQQPTMQLQAAPPQGQIIMVQMPDGRMVPAQIQGQVAPPQQQVIYQQPVQQQQYVQPQQQQQVVVVPQPQAQPQVHPSAPGNSGYQQVQVSPPAYVPGSEPYVPDEPVQPAYNPGYNEEGGEGAKPTDAAYQYK